MLLWRASFGRVALGRAVWRAAFVHVGSAYSRTMIRGVCAVVKGGFWGICRRMQDGGDSRLRGNDGGGTGRTGGGGGMTGGVWEWKPESASCRNGVRFVIQYACVGIAE